MNTSHPPQISAGTSSLNGRGLWHTDLEGKFWCGHTHHRTPEQLYAECVSTIEDLAREFPAIAQKDSRLITAELLEACEQAEHWLREDSLALNRVMPVSILQILRDVITKAGGSVIELED